jgi:hypothetical protein
VAILPERVELAGIHVPFVAPAGDGGVADLGTVVVPSRESRLLRLVDEEGRDEAGSWIETLEENALLAPDSEIEHRNLLDLESGLSVRVRNERPDRLPYVRRLEGPGPWTLRRPAGVVEVRATEREDGSPVGGFVVHVDGVEFLGEAGRCVVGGLEAGRHRVLVSRPDRPTAVEARFGLVVGETKRVEAALPPRPE